MAKRTKIVCTLGPAVDSESALRGLIVAGMDVARLNLSHATREGHAARIDRLKKVRRELGIPVARKSKSQCPGSSTKRSRC